MSSYLSVCTQKEFEAFEKLHKNPECPRLAYMAFSAKLDVAFQFHAVSRKTLERARDAQKRAPADDTANCQLSDAEKMFLFTSKRVEQAAVACRDAELAFFGL
jgi:hypothetical protein